MQFTLLKRKVNEKVRKEQKENGKGMILKERKIKVGYKG